MKINEKQNGQHQALHFLFIKISLNLLHKWKPNITFTTTTIILILWSRAAKSYTVSTFLFKGLITNYTSTVD